ncbi:carbohydrate kinase family protein [Aquibium sp. LZ166]|uniref:Carbohydrate kinase family protein n=1 Tax=Aquibium pacificus TaxID=3153579 RepID=A0ABV3SDJ2_9HYPH
MNATVAITGYASLDHVAMLDSVPTPGRTSTIVSRSEDAWPRLGGSPAYVAAALVAGGIVNAVPVSWVGDDQAGEHYVEQLRSRHIPTGGVEIVSGARTPMAILAYDPHGGCSCLYEPGMPADLTLSAAQTRLIVEAGWLCVTIGPIGATKAALEALRPETKLAWIVKNDPRALPPDLASRLALRADLVFHSQAEKGFLATAHAGASNIRAGQIVLETQGRGGAVLKRNGVMTSVSTSPIECSDPTGAGDTFAGGVIAALAKGETDMRAVVEAGHRAAGALLGARQTNLMESA